MLTQEKQYKSACLLRRVALLTTIATCSLFLASCGGGSEATPAAESADSTKQALAVSGTAATVPGGWAGRAQSNIPVKADDSPIPGMTGVKTLIAPGLYVFALNPIDAQPAPKLQITIKKQLLSTNLQLLLGEVGYEFSGMNTKRAKAAFVTNKPVFAVLACEKSGEPECFEVTHSLTQGILSFSISDEYYFLIKIKGAN